MNPQMNSSFDVLENPLLKMIITDQGRITSLYNKKTHTEIIKTAKPTVITTLGEWNEKYTHRLKNQVVCIILTAITTWLCFYLLRITRKLITNNDIAY
jgi:hypothetical protein